jgi:5-methylcytosine-specific restriction endonuclease McrA
VKRTPLKRGAALARGSGLARATPLRRGKSKARARVPAPVRQQVKARTGGRCAACMAQPVHQLHHVLPQQRFPELALEPLNMVGLCVDCHAAHEYAPGRRLALHVVACARPLLTDGPRRAYFNRIYNPAAGIGGKYHHQEDAS